MNPTNRLKLKIDLITVKIFTQICSLKRKLMLYNSSQTVVLVCFFQSILVVSYLDKYYSTLIITYLKRMVLTIYLVKIDGVCPLVTDPQRGNSNPILHHQNFNRNNTV